MNSMAEEIEMILEKDQEPQTPSVQELTGIINCQLSEIAELHRKNTKIYQQIGTLQEEISEKEVLMIRLQEEKEKLEASGEKKDISITEWRAKANRLTEENKQMFEQLQTARAVANDLAQHISQMENSRSWKVTKPLRAVIGLFRQSKSI